jgi:hypothetical protein
MSWFVAWCWGVPVWAHALIAAWPCERRAGSGGAERSRSDAAGALDAGCREPIIGRLRVGVLGGLPVEAAAGVDGGGVPGRRGGCRHCHSHMRGLGSQVGASQDGAPYSGRESRVRSKP